MRAAGLLGCSALIAASTRKSSVVENDRASISKVAKSGTELVVVPALNMVGTTVVPCSEFSSDASCKTKCEISTVELMPFSGSRPA